MKKIITIVILAFITTSLFAQAPNPFPKTIQVNGSAEIEIIPDEIYVVVTLKEYEKKGTGKISLENIKSRFLNICRNAGIPDSLIKIASYEGANPATLWNKKKAKDELYASIAYQIKFTSSKKIDELVNKLDDNATQNFEVLRVSHSKLQEYRKQVKIMAIKAAKEKAGYLTEAVGEKLGEAVTIYESGYDYLPSINSGYGGGLMTNAVRSVSDNSNSESIDFEKIRITMQISVVFAIK